MKISSKVWGKYTKTLDTLNRRAAGEMEDFYTALVEAGQSGGQLRANLIDMAWRISRRYGEAAGAAACEMYDAIAAMEAASVPAAMPAATATRKEAARAIDNALYKSKRADVIGAAAGKLVKLAGADTTLLNAKRDGAEWAWIPSGGETCAYCIELAGQGWMPASKAQMDGDHAEHIHANCMCTFAIRFNADLDVAGYEPNKYEQMYEDAPGDTEEEKLNSMRREFYAENKAEINAQKRDAYEKRKELNSPDAEETIVN